MKKRRIVSSEKLYDAVEAGQLDKDIISKFGLEHRRAQPDEKTVKARRKQRLGTTSEQVNDPLKEKMQNLTVNKRGSLVIPRELVDMLGLDEGDTFNILKTDRGLSLRRK